MCIDNANDPGTGGNAATGKGTIVKSVKNPDGSTTDTYKNGHTVKTFKSGKTVTNKTNGTKLIDRPGDRPDTKIKPDGTKIKTFSDGKIVKTLTDGSVVVTPAPVKDQPYKVPTAADPVAIAAYDAAKRKAKGLKGYSGTIKNSGLDTGMTAAMYTPLSLTNGSATKTLLGK